MQDLIKRYFWVLGGIVVVVCAVFAAKATTHIVEAKFLGDAHSEDATADGVPHGLAFGKVERVAECAEQLG